MYYTVFVTAAKPNRFAIDDGATAVTALVPDGASTLVMQLRMEGPLLEQLVALIIQSY